MLDRIARRKVRPQEIISKELARLISETSFELGRQIGLVISRRGEIEQVIVGNADRLYLPDFGRFRMADGRFRGLRLVHTHLKGEGLSDDDLTDLALLRLDVIAVITVSSDGLPDRIQVAHLLPENSEQKHFEVSPLVNFHSYEEDFTGLMGALEEQFSRIKGRELHDGISRERVYLVGVTTGPVSEEEERLDELAELARTAGLEVAGRMIQRRFKIDNRYVMGSGRLRDMLIECMQADAEILVFDRELTPGQLRSLADYTEMRVLDRTQLILDIFAQRAQSRDGKLQVELAQLKYRLPRLAQSRDKAFSRLMGGIGGRGPGEQKLEIDRRRIRSRIAHLEKQVDKLTDQRRLRRSNRRRSGAPVVGLVGYTNAGKSTILNRMTKSKVFVEDKLFATLDPTSRRIRFSDESEMVLVDTVGFIRELPKELTSAFRATLEELSEADLLLHVVDISNAHYEDHIVSVEKILKDLELHELPFIMVFNKIDLLPDEVYVEPGEADKHAAISAKTGLGLPRLLSMMRTEIEGGKGASSHSGPVHLSEL